jgi:hypothetical protein
LQAAEAREVEQVRIRQEASRQTRFEVFLDSMNDAERRQAATQLCELPAHDVTDTCVSAGPGGLAVDGLQ